MVETDAGIMTWPIALIGEARTYCDEGEEPVLLYAGSQSVEPENEAQCAQLRARVGT